METTSPEQTIHKEHMHAVQRVQEQVKLFNGRSQKFRINHGSTSTTRPRRKSEEHTIDIRDLTRVFPVDKAAKSVKVEPNVPMDVLVAHTLGQQLVPKVVMELKGITVGGGFSGISGESSTFKYGLFSSTVSDIEIVLGDGSLKLASRYENEDLLLGAAGTMGTLGVVVLLTVELMEAQDFVNLELIRAPILDDIPGMLESAAKREVDFIDSISFDDRSAVIMVGKMSQRPIGTLFDGRKIRWFADQIYKLAHDQAVNSVSLRLEDYLFRYDHGAFWGARLAFKHFHVPQNTFTRLVAERFLDSRTCYRALHHSGLAGEYVIQDFILPSSKVNEFLTYVRSRLPEIQIFLCPGQSMSAVQMESLCTTHFTAILTERLFGVGVYGRGPSTREEFTQLNRDFEQRVHECYGMKLLYARCFYTETEFWKIMNQDFYMKLRDKYSAGNLPTVFEKIYMDMQRPEKFRPRRAILKTIFNNLIGTPNSRQYKMNRSYQQGTKYHNRGLVRGVSIHGFSAVAVILILRITAVYYIVRKILQVVRSFIASKWAVLSEKNTQVLIYFAISKSCLELAVSIGKKV